MSGWMFCPGKEQLSRVTAAAHSVSRWINQSVFRLSPSISENNLGDIIKVPFCHSRGQGALLPSSSSSFFFFLTLLCHCYRGSRSGLNRIQISVFGVAAFQVFAGGFFFFPFCYFETTAWNIFRRCDSGLNRNSLDSITFYHFFFFPLDFLFHGKFS